MNTETSKVPVTSRLLGLLCSLRIRQLLLVVFGLLSLIALSALAWNGLYVWRQFENVERMVESNAIGQRALALNAKLARERGLTAAILANPASHTAQIQTRLQALREASDLGLRTLFHELALHEGHMPMGRDLHQRLDRLDARLTELRARSDAALREGSASIGHHEWIEAFGMVNLMIVSPSQDEEHSSRYGLLIKEAFFTFSEFAGRERALLSAVIAQQRPLRMAEQQQLRFYQNITQEAEKRIQRILTLFPETEEITRAQAELATIYHEDYQALRQSILYHSQNTSPYPVDAQAWFEQATRAIDTILGLAHAVSLHLDEDIASQKELSRHTVYALIATVALVISVFIVAFLATYRRILMPLRTLEASAHTIASGDFSQATQVLAQDEFGELAQAFEVMRTYLFNDRERRRHAENELRKLNTAIEQSVSSIIITDINGTTEYVNPQFHATTGYPAEEVIGRKFNLLGSGETPHATYTELWNTIKSGGVWQGELLNRKKDGSLYWDLVSISPVRDKNNQITHFIGIQHDITERKEMEERLNYMAYHDELTALPNRTLLTDRFEQQVRQAQRSGDKIALLILDLDRFKLINDSLGHRIGDLVLIEIARRLTRTARGGDTIARYGGDEFVILASGFSDSDALIEIARRLVEIIAEPVVIEGHNLHVSTSIGISLWPDDGPDIETLLRQADTAMYHAKELGRGRFQFFTSELNIQTSHRLKLETDLREAIEQQQFELYYQPQVHLVTGKIMGAEALIRWNHPELGLVSPIEFIPLAEETQLIRPIGEWVLRTACEQAAQWQQSHHADFSMAVNVSARQLDDARFTEYLASMLEETGIRPGTLEVEITESSVMAHPDRMIGVLNTIKSLGIHLALDDFGTGYSSLSYLRRFPFDKLKIDRSFIKDVTHNPDDAAITQTIGAMAHSLNMTVIAEGVETDIQASYLQRCGCDEIQGYLISRPVPQQAFEALLDQPPPLRLGDDKISEPTVLVVGAEPQVRQALRAAIQHPWLRILEADDGYAALDTLASHSVQAIIVDCDLTGLDGLELLNRIKELHPATLRVAITGKLHRESTEKVINQGTVHRIFSKPWREEELKSTVLDAFQQNTA